MNISEYLRWNGLGGVIIKHVVIDDVSSVRSKILYQLEKIGNNINQIAKLSNSGYVTTEMFRTELRDMGKDIQNNMIHLMKIDEAYNRQFTKAMASGSKYIKIDQTKGADKDGSYQTSGK